MAGEPSTLDKVLALADRITVGIPIAGQMVSIADVSIHALVALLNDPATDKSKLDQLHGEYQARIAAREAQIQPPPPSSGTMTVAL